MSVNNSAMESDLPLLMPLGFPDENNSQSDNVENGTIESVSGPLKRFILNELLDRGRSLSESFTRVQNARNDYEYENQPGKVLRILLQRTIEELQLQNDGKHAVTENDAERLREMPDVVRIFRKTSFLVDVDLTELLTSVEQTTCFLINLANLMWIHALLFTDDETRRGLLFKSWPLRQIYFNSVGYNISHWGFVSLYDLHGILFNFPFIFRSKTLCKLNVLYDPRIHFLVAQPNTFSPKIEAVDEHSLEKLMEDSKNDYLCKFAIVKDMKLFIPLPLLLYMERVSYDQNVDSELIKSANGGLEKWNILIEMLRSKRLPYEKLLSQDIYIVHSTQFKIKFSHSVNEFEEVKTLKTIVWRGCRVHRSLYHCLTHHTNIVRSTMLDDHLSQFACACVDKTSQSICNNNTFLTMAKVFHPLLNKFKYDSNYSHKGLRCLYAALAFSGAASTYIKATDLQLDEMEEFRYLYKIIEIDFMSIPTSYICAKIKTCLKILVSEYDIHLRWPHWFDVYFADANVIFDEIVEHGNAALACMWMAVQLKYDPNFKFFNEVNCKFYSLLRDLKDTSYLKQAFAYTKDVPLADIIDSLISLQCDIPKIINIVNTIVEINNLDKKEKTKFSALLIGLNMITRIDEIEQTYYFKLAYYPHLIVEQLILNKKIELLKKVLTDITQIIHSLPLEIQEEESVSRSGIDQLLRRYAEKALHFRRTIAAVHCESDALKHASIFKEGDTFYPPEKVPTEEEWISNNLAEVCSVCRREFSVFTRRNHCRRCGRVVCNSCSTKRLKISIYDSPQRVCEACFNFESRFGTVEDETNQPSCSNNEEKKGKRPLWQLDTDPTLNDYIRNQAIFDTAPDIELCLSLLELHSENHTVPRFLMEKANIMLKILRQRLVCPANFDYPEVTHIVRSLLLAAKVYYVHLGDMQGTRQCEELTSESVMLNQLAKSKFSPPEPNKPIRDVQDWKQVRNVLLEKQNWELALEISTKNGLECESIWYLWAMNLLKSGDWPAARDKFARSNLRKNANMLNSVLEILYSSSDKETSNRFTKFFQSNSKKAVFPEKVYKECLYYLKTYGSGDQLFDLYIESDRIFEAVQTTFAKKIAPKKFVKKIYIPFLKNNEQAKILKYMENVDFTLIGWKDYAHEICLHCSSNKHFDALYETQLWLKDYYQAALSCTMFYKMQAKSYADLMKNKHHLLTAVSHFNVAASRIKQKENTKLEQIVDPRRIEKYINTVNLQLQVAEIISENAVCAVRQYDMVPTLFGADKERLDVIMLILDSIECIEQAFELLRSIVDAYSMDTKSVYGKIAIELMKNNKESSVVKLVQHVKESMADDKTLVDVICSQVIRMKPQKPDLFIYCITDDILKFDLMIESGYLKSAYMLAVKMKRMDFVEKVLIQAKRLNKFSVEKLCRIKLQTMKKPS